MAIAFDAAALSNASGTSLTYSHTCTGSNLILIVFVVNGTDATDAISGVTYNGVSLTRLNTSSNTAGNERTFLYYLIGPATGAHNVVISASSSISILGASGSYTGALSLDDGNTSSTNGTSLTCSIITHEDNEWLIGGARNKGTNITAGAGTTIRTSAQTWGIMDKNAAITPPGSASLIQTSGGAQELVSNIVGISTTAYVRKPNFLALF